MPFLWTPEIDKLMIEMWDQGVGSKNIGAKLGTSKGSVIGRHRRLTMPKAPIVAHPAFDPIASMWFLEDGTEAKSIRDLLAKLPKGSTIKDYNQRC